MICGVRMDRISARNLDKYSAVDISKTFGEGHSNREIKYKNGELYNSKSAAETLKRMGFSEKTPFFGSMIANHNRKTEAAREMITSAFADVLDPATFDQVGLFGQREGGAPQGAMTGAFIKSELLELERAADQGGELRQDYLSEIHRLESISDTVDDPALVEVYGTDNKALLRALVYNLRGFDYSIFEIENVLKRLEGAAHSSVVEAAVTRGGVFQDERTQLAVDQRLLPGLAWVVSETCGLYNHMIRKSLPDETKQQFLDTLGRLGGVVSIMAAFDQTAMQELNADLNATMAKLLSPEVGADAGSPALSPETQDALDNIDADLDDLIAQMEQDSSTSDTGSDISRSESSSAEAFSAAPSVADLFALEDLDGFTSDEERLKALSLLQLLETRQEAYDAGLELNPLDSETIDYLAQVLANMKEQVGLSPDSDMAETGLDVSSSDSSSVEAPLAEAPRAEYFEVENPESFESPEDFLRDLLDFIDSLGSPFGPENLDAGHTLDSVAPRPDPDDTAGLEAMDAPEQGQDELTGDVASESVSYEAVDIDEIDLDALDQVLADVRPVLEGTVDPGEIDLDALDQLLADVEDMRRGNSETMEQ